MPTYEYRCKQCEHELEAVQGFHDDPLTECPECGGPLRKKFGSVGISFKGSGFYKNDSRSSTGAKSTSESSSGDKTSPDKTSTDKTSTDKTSTGATASSDSSSSGSGSGDSGSKDKTPAAT
jgi:putative FmdB family regulatory protein